MNTPRGKPRGIKRRSHLLIPPQNGGGFTLLASLGQNVNELLSALRQDMNKFLSCSSLDKIRISILPLAR
ncbi:MAG: hypothetical protein A2736_02810 [Candidatus Yanofskybacteria bacterium RIFCSPHIGHO2_01_FULL_41_27]|uniref:Uncharacterized protein n=2 Tax=Candidatus Yanofskyibacteriota TaxID=1752733 RepID=A0A1F8HUR8_9BACT|nr:MAG: hypothetical protein A2736_02810 [Candidatus Yanofskybacteria bacterium RIFCSPHIGHO2_01_FULL_41_27]OGN19588.1 MAG: hypothetical protein A3B00_01600 [Candidatus Yanofskybacteria bacterium RIFCSPLOWO2_01_FULL_41_33]OGN40889.1 MAG: hypothetical protein A2606_02800 [Candidatus Yanofskybacteria bacterium RIFOXYD1_FULL_42_10]